MNSFSAMRIVLLLCFLVLIVSDLVYACRCNREGALTENCDKKTRQCLCKRGFAGRKCDLCMNMQLVFPNCQSTDAFCSCHSNGTFRDYQKPSACIDRISCKCKRHVQGSDCSRCKPMFYNLTRTNTNGCESCRCSEEGSFGKLMTCHNETGQCYCKPNINGVKCDRCEDGYRFVDQWNFFGCVACNCNRGGSKSRKCNNVGSCHCKENVEGDKCDRIKPGNHFLPHYFHNMFEVESSKHERRPVIFRYNDNEFPHFTGQGYVAFGTEQHSIYLDIEVPKARVYRAVLHYLLKEGEQRNAKMDVEFINNDHELNILGTVEFSSKVHPSYASLVIHNKKQELFLHAGSWIVKLNCFDSGLLVDHLVIIPSDYYSPTTIEPDHVAQCTTSKSANIVCLMYKYIDLTESNQLIQAESGTNSRGYGRDEIIFKTNLFNDPVLLQQLPVIDEMALLSRDQIALTLSVRSKNTNTYHLVVTYFNPDDVTYRLDFYNGDSGQRGFIETVPCLYTFLCRAVVIKANGEPLLLRYENSKQSNVTFLGNIRGSLALDYIALVPTSLWTPDLIIPSVLCYMQNRSCLQNTMFEDPVGATSLTATEANPASLITSSVVAREDSTVYFTANNVKRGSYELIYQFYQPTYPTFAVRLKVNIDGITQLVDNIPVSYCPSNVGCRSLYAGDLNVVKSSRVTLTMRIPQSRKMWIDSLMLVPRLQYDTSMLTPKRTESIKAFKQTCLDDQGLPLLDPPPGYCVNTWFTLISQFVGDVMQCDCHKHGAVSTACNRMGGQCVCKPGVIGRKCDACRTGYYGFPRCKPCNCFLGGSLHAGCDRFGHCSCKPTYESKKCNECRKGHWGFPVCKPCDCDQTGSFSLACRGYDGQCSCVRRFGGLRCDKCQVGYYSFPSCQKCNCQAAGIKVSLDYPTGCYPNDPNHCDCKRNVAGKDCGQCKEQYFGLSQHNPHGCQRCNCSAFGTVQGVGVCDQQSGQCVCQPNVVGERCDTCMDGWTVSKASDIFSCQPCQCSMGGSLHSVCDKQTGQCKCKPRVSGLNCDRQSLGGFFLPPIGQFVFTGVDIVPNARWQHEGAFDGVKVNGSYATSRLRLYVQKPSSYYILVHYALPENDESKLNLEFFKPGEHFVISHTLKPATVGKGQVEVMKSSYKHLLLNLTQGDWYMQVLLDNTILLNQITLAPIEHFSANRITRTIQNPCTIKDEQRHCALYTYQDLFTTRTLVFEAESVASGPVKYLDTQLYKGANINGAVLLETELSFSKWFTSLHGFNIVVQYLNMDSPAQMQVLVNTDDGTEFGSMFLPVCRYAFACRQVVLLNSVTKAVFKRGSTTRYIKLKLKQGNAVYIDFISLVPVRNWRSNLITPTFYCSMRSSRCMESQFPTTPRMVVLETESSLDVSLKDNSPPNAQGGVIGVLISSYQRDLRWTSQLPTGGHYIIIHYYQPLFDMFVGKIVVTTFQRALAGKATFNYCPSVYGCRVVIQYLEEDYMQRFLLRGNSLRVTFTVPRHARVWVDRLLFVPTNELEEHSNLLTVNPLDLSKRYLRKCAGRRDKYIKKSNKAFCRSATFELTLALNIYPQPCSCDPRGTLQSDACNPHDGQCSCKQGFRGRKCGRCKAGFYPRCKEIVRYLG